MPRSAGNHSVPFPGVEWSEHWVFDRSLTGKVTGTLVGSVFFALAISPFLGVSLDETVAFVGACGGGLMFASIGIIFIHRSEWRAPSGNSGIKRNVNGTYGPGIALVPRRATDMILASIIAGCSLYCFCFWLDWKLGSDNLLPYSNANPSGAILMLVVSVVTLVLLVIIGSALKWKIAIEVYSDGILRRTPSAFFGQGKRIFVPWDEMKGIVPERFSSGKASNLPIIYIELAESRKFGPGVKLFDKPGRIGLPVYLTRCDLNTLLSIVLSLKANPDQRDLLKSPDIDEWFLQVARQGRTPR